MTTPAMRRFLAERDRHLETCTLRDPQRWLAAQQLLAWADRAHAVEGYGSICVECGGILGGEPSNPLRTRQEILDARADDVRAGGRGGETAVGKRLGISDSEVQRLRTRFGLIPWPDS